MKGPIVTLQIGSTAKNYRLENPALLADLEARIAAFVFNSAATQVYANSIPKITKAVQEASDNEIARFMPFIAQNLIGIQTPRDSSDTEIKMTDRDPQPVMTRGPVQPPGTVWSALTTAWRRKKKANHNTFFVHTGALRRLLANEKTAQRVLLKLGGATVEIKTSGGGKPAASTTAEIPKDERVRKAPGRQAGGIVTIAEVKISYGKGLTSYNTSAIGSQLSPNMALERKIGLSASAIEKLTGPPRRHRPLMQPAVQYWFFFKLPRVIQVALNKELQAVTRGRKGLGNS